MPRTEPVRVLTSPLIISLLSSLLSRISFFYLNLIWSDWLLNNKHKAKLETLATQNDSTSPTGTTTCPCKWSLVVEWPLESLQWAQMKWELNLNQGPLIWTRKLHRHSLLYPPSGGSADVMNKVEGSAGKRCTRSWSIAHDRSYRRHMGICSYCHWISSFRSSTSHLWGSHGVP
jgi:hypothetical protein